MEGARVESFLGHTVIPEAADGDFGLATDVAGQLFHRVFLLPMAGRVVAHPMVDGASAGHLAYFPYTCQVDSRIACPSGSRYHHEC